MSSHLLQRGKDAIETNNSTPTTTTRNVDYEQINLSQVIHDLQLRIKDNENEKKEIIKSLYRSCPNNISSTTGITTTTTTPASKKKTTTSSALTPTMDIVPAFQNSFKEILNSSFPSSSSSSTSTTKPSSSSSSGSNSSTSPPKMETHNFEPPRIDNDVNAIVNQLTAKLVSASTLASRVSAQVNALDRQRARVSNALEAVSNIIYLRNCANNVDLALSKSNVQDAAVQVERFRSRGSSVYVDANQIEAVERSAEQVVKQVTLMLNDGLRNNDKDQVRSSLVTFSYLGSDTYNAAVETYIQYSLQSLRKYAADNKQTVDSGRNQGLLLSKLLNRTSEMMSNAIMMFDEIFTFKWISEKYALNNKEGQNESVKNANVGRAPVVEVVMRLHEGCSMIACNLLSSFSTDSNLDLLTNNNDIKTQRDAGSCQHVLNESAILCQRCESYLRWLTTQGLALLSSAKQKYITMNENKDSADNMNVDDDGNLDGNDDDSSTLFLKQ